MTTSIGARVGELAPGFSLPDHRGGRVRLDDLRGSPVLLHFFPFAFTGVCAGEWAQLGTLAPDLARTGTVLLGISCDSPYALAEFARQAGIAADLLSDFWPHGQVTRDYGLLIEDKGFGLRGSVLIDRTGVVRWVEVSGPAQPRDPEQARTALMLLE